MALQVGGAPLAAGAPSLDDPWEDVLRTRYTAASKKFERLHAANPDDRRIAVAHAAALLTRDPMTRGNVRKARATLINVVNETPASEAEYRPLALLLLGRIDHDHVEPVQFESARAFYEQLRSEYPEHTLADQAAVQLMMLAYWQHSATEPEAVAEELEAILPSVKSQYARLMLHTLAVGLYSDKLGDWDAVLRHLATSLAQGSTDHSIHLRIGWVARKIGLPKLAAEHYRAFAQAAPRDIRAHTSLRIARELEQEEPSAAQPGKNE
ncbi:tetratricopeptide repeat protein [Cephaloticoccus primus]|uniref:tetratricopeptide repeat protein n=1 Tax=Cephaloticoccus primus TaxID=1548207 RepID=UPI0012E9412D|nr:hypothetical protein [Cephaloticoccus primus]